MLATLMMQWRLGKSWSAKAALVRNAYGKALRVTFEFSGFSETFRRKLFRVRQTPIDLSINILQLENLKPFMDILVSMT